MTFARLILVATLAFGTSLSAYAHNAWLLASSTTLSKTDWITVDAAVSNDLFNFNYVPLGLENLQITAPNGTQKLAENPFKGKLRSVFDLQVDQIGTYQIAIVGDSLFASYKNKAGENKRWRGSAENFSKEIPTDAKELKVSQSISRIETFVTLGKPSKIQPKGQGLELIPVTAPTDLVKGEKANFIMHLDGKPAADLDIIVVAGGTRYRNSMGEIKIKTNTLGEFSVTWPSAGMYWIEVETKDQKTSLPQAKERRVSYTATLEVQP